MAAGSGDILMFATKKNRVLCAALAASLLVSGAPAIAATATLVVAATVLASCIVVGSTIAFGNDTSSQVDQTGNIAVLCTNGTSYTIGLDASASNGLLQNLTVYGRIASAPPLAGVYTDT